MTNNSLVEQETQEILNAVNNATNTQINASQNANVTMAANGEMVDESGNVLNAEATAQVNPTISNLSNANSPGIKTNNYTLAIVIIAIVGIFMIIGGNFIPNVCIQDDFNDMICNASPVSLVLMGIGFILAVGGIIAGIVNK